MNVNSSNGHLGERLVTDVWKGQNYSILTFEMKILVNGHRNLIEQID